MWSNLLHMRSCKTPDFVWTGNGLCLRGGPLHICLKTISSSYSINIRENYGEKRLRVSRCETSPPRKDIFLFSCDRCSGVRQQPTTCSLFSMLNSILDTVSNAGWSSFVCFCWPTQIQADTVHHFEKCQMIWHSHVTWGLKQLLRW